MMLEHGQNSSCSMIGKENDLMKPLLIFQLPKDANQTEREILCNIISDGIEKGALILDSRITILSFDEDGNMNYCTGR